MFRVIQPDRAKSRLCDTMYHADLILHLRRYFVYLHAYKDVIVSRCVIVSRIRDLAQTATVVLGRFTGYVLPLDMQTVTRLFQLGKLG